MESTSHSEPPMETEVEYSTSERSGVTYIELTIGSGWPFIRGRLEGRCKIVFIGYFSGGLMDLSLFK